MNAIQRVQEAILEIQKGNMVIMLDDEDRENEGDLVYAAPLSTPEKVNFMALRSISNYVGPRQKEKWDIGLALENLSETIKSFLSVLS